MAGERRDPPYNPSFALQLADGSSAAAAGPFSGKVLRGFMRNQFEDDDGIQWRLNFLYNPSVLNISYQIDRDDLHMDQDLSEADKQGVGLVDHRSMSIDLLFDRTLEVARDPSNHTGVQVDVDIFHAMMGVKNIHEDPIQTRAVEVFISREGGSPVPLISLFGLVTSAQLTYTHFSNLMVPMRCVLKLGIQQQIKPRHMDNINIYNEFDTTGPGSPSSMGFDSRPQNTYHTYPGHGN